jgi:predicted phosphodiesterase
LAGIDPDRLTTVRELSSNGPTQVQIDTLPPDSTAYLQCQFRRKGSSQWHARPVRTLATARAQGKAFRIALLADSHAYYAKQHAEYSRNIANACDHVLRDNPDFVIFLGDEASVRYRDDKPGFMNQDRAIERWKLWRTQFAPLLASLPSYLVIGNHEGEAGYYQKFNHGGTVNYYQRWGTIARKRFFLNPLPSTYPEGGENQGWSGARHSRATGGASDGNCTPLQNYFAWTWGDATFVVLDVHRYTNIGGALPDDPRQWTLGETQLAWLQQTLNSSRARWKFVLAHHLVGGWGYDLTGQTRITDYSYARGGARYARVGQQARITDTMKRTNARFFLYGHDHIFAHQQAEGIHFICCGRPTHLDSNWWVTPGWLEAYGRANARNPHHFYGAIGYTRLSISPDCVEVQYVRTGTDSKHTGNVTTPIGKPVYTYATDHPT